MESRDASVPEPVHPPGTVPGKWVVVGMFGFAMLAVSLMYLYWDLHTAPFRPLQEALGREFPYSRPLVQGGRRKMHKGTPSLLRIVMRIEFDPYLDERKTQAFADEITAFAQEHHDVSQYDAIEVHLHWPEPESEIKQWTTTIPLEDGSDDAPTDQDEE